jgi:hypothetical protein
MNHQFDELTKGLAQPVSRRAVLKQFGIGLAGMALACFGLANKGVAQTACQPNYASCFRNTDCCSGRCRKSGGWFAPQRKHCVP